MEPTVTCPTCGTANLATYRYCTNCRTVLRPETAAAAPAVPPPTPTQMTPPGSEPTAPPAFPPADGGPPPTWGVPAWGAQWTKQVDRTRTGVMLLLIGTLLAWIPLVSLLGGLLTLIGAIFVILGRKAFGSTHSRNVVISIVLIVVGIVAGIALGIVFAFALAGAFVPGAPPPDAVTVQAAFNTLLAGVVVVSVIVGLASVLFTYALQNQTGKALLWAAYAMSIVLQIVIFAVVAPEISGAVAEAFASGSVDLGPLDALSARIDTLNLLTVLPSVLYAGAYYIAWSRIRRREIPVQPHPTIGPEYPLPPSPPA